MRTTGISVARFNAGLYALTGDTNEAPCGHITIGNDPTQIPIFNLKCTAPTRKPAMSSSFAAKAPISDTEQLIRDFAAASALDIATVRAIVNDGIMATPPVTPAESLAELHKLINRGIVLHSTAAKGQSRKNIRKRDPRRKQIVGPSKKRTAAERRAASDKLREHRRKMA